MYAITGITGKVGGAAARALLAAGQPVRAVMRSLERGQVWADQGCKFALAEMTDQASLTAAFADTEGVFILPPSEFDPLPGFPEARAVINAVKGALEASQPRKVVCLSTIGAQATQSNLLSQRTLMEEALQDLPLPVTFLRPSWFMENALWDVEAARSAGIIQSFLQPLDKAIPMVATADVGTIVARLLQEDWVGKRVVELQGPRKVSPNDLAATFSKVLGRPVSAQAVPRDSWGALFKSQGMRDPMPRIQMLDGFNEGWIDFEGSEISRVRGETELETVLRTLVA